VSVGLDGAGTRGVSIIRRKAMRLRQQIEARLPAIGKAGIFLGLAGALAGLYICLVRVPALAQSKLEELFGTLLATAVSLLFVVLVLLIHLAVAASRLTRDQTAANLGDGREMPRQLNPGAQT
jgi:hypothetical protein